jgi:hypothetical protein
MFYVDVIVSIMWDLSWGRVGAVDWGRAKKSPLMIRITTLLQMLIISTHASTKIPKVAISHSVVM